MGELIELSNAKLVKYYNQTIQLLMEVQPRRFIPIKNTLLIPLTSGFADLLETMIKTKKLFQSELKKLNPQSKEYEQIHTAFRHIEGIISYCNKQKKNK